MVSEKSIDDINMAILELWHEWHEKYKKPGEKDLYAPLQYSKLEKGAILFVGLNPSFPADKFWKRKFQERPNLLGGKQPSEFFKWPIDDNKTYTELVREYEKHAREIHPYFKPLKDISKNIGKKFEHIDMFPIRKTNSDEVLALVKGENEGLNDFGEKLFKIFNDLLLIAKPKAVVINNAKASNIFIKKRDPEYDTSTGVYWDSCDGQGFFPVFFTAIITGGHVDLFSRERLARSIAGTLSNEPFPTELWAKTNKKLRLQEKRSKS